MIREFNKKVKALGLLLVASLAVSMTGCGTPISTEYDDIDLSQYVKLGAYKDIEVTQSSTEVSDDEIQAEIQKRVSSASTTKEVKKGTAKEGDRVKIVYTGKLNGEAFEGGSTGNAGTTITLGSSGYIPGFDDGVIGMKVGEKKDIDLTFPEDYGKEELDGQDVVFEVELKAIIEDVVPEYNLAFVKKNSDATSLEEYEQQIKQELAEQKKALADEEVKDQIWQQVVDNAETIKLPEDKVEEAHDQFVQYYESYATQSGMDFSTFIGLYLGMDEDSFEQYAQQYAEAVIKQELVMFSIAKEERISLSKSEYDKMLKEYMTLQGVDDSMFKATYGQTFEEYAGKDNLVKTFTLEKVLDTLVQYSKISTK